MLFVPLSFRDKWNSLCLALNSEQSQTLKIVVFEFFKRYFFENSRMIEAETQMPRPGQQ
jgi:hypothetical protein